MSKKAIDVILWEEGFYPFSMKYDIRKAYEKKKEELESCEIDITAKSIFKHSNYFNFYFKDICKKLNEVVGKSLLSNQQLIELIIADLNRSEIILSEEYKKKLINGDSFDHNTVANAYIEKPEFQNGSESAWGLIDGLIDTAILNLNYLKYIKFNEKVEITNELSQVNVIKNLSQLGMAYMSIKHAYDRIIWREDSIEFEDSLYKLKSNLEHMMLENAALTRLTSNSMSVQNELIYMPEKYKDIISFYHATRRFQVIKSVETKNDSFLIKFQSKEQKPVYSFFTLIAPLLTYYPFYRSKKISHLEDLTILDLVNLFSILHDLINCLPMPDYNDTGVMDLKKFNLFNPKINKSVFLNYFKTTTKYSESQILTFIKLLTQKGDVHDLYQFPIYEDEKNYFFATSTIFRGNILFLVDRWLDVGKCDLSDRGYEFEDYIKDFLKTEKLNAFAQFKLVEKSTFSFINSHGKKVEEEIDIVLVTGSTIIVGEIKCISYPLDPNDFYSSYQVIKKAKNQIVRKAQFLDENWEEFKDILGERSKRTIEKIIIVNFPHFSGRNIDGIPVSDFYLFLSYFKSGQLTRAKLEKGKLPIYNNLLYYNSIASFETNFKLFFSKPVPIDEVIKRQEVEEYEATVKGTEPKTISFRVKYNAITS